MIVIENGTVWNGRRDDEPCARTIVIEGQSVTRILPAGQSVDVAPEASIINASGKFVMPGIINCHTHICMDGDPKAFTGETESAPRIAVKAALSAAKTLREGITTIRDMGGITGIDIAIRDMIEDGVILGPRMLVSGQAICMTGGHGHRWGCEADGAAEARKAARAQLKAGADQLKVIATGGVLTKGVEPGAPQLTVDEMKAVVEEAIKAGTHVAAHAHGNTGIVNAVKAGVKTIEHGTFLDEKAADLMLAHDAYCTPTFISAQRIYEHGVQGGIPDSVRKIKEMMAPRSRSLRIAIDKGLKIIIGTDAGTFMNYHGMDSVLGQLVILHQEGMAIKDILVSATSQNAEALGIAHRIGILQAGMQADMILVDGNPMTDLNVLKNVSIVIKGGQIVARQ